MAQGFFLNPTLIQEICLWRSNTGENLLVFEPIARACASLGAILVPEDAVRAAQVSKVLEAWCSSPDFESLLAEANKTKSSISTDLGRETLCQFSGSPSFVVGVPIDLVISAFSALIRADLRSRESRSIARIDEVFIWQACLKQISLHDITLLILSALASKNVMNTFDQLLAIKDEPGTLKQIDSNSLSTELSPHFRSGMRLFALSNFEAAETAYSLAIEKAPQSPSVYLAMSLLQIINANFTEALRLVEEAATKSDSNLIASIRHLISILQDKEAPVLWANDPISLAVLLFFYLRKRQYSEVVTMADQHLIEFPQDLIMQELVIEAMILPIRDSLFNDPPLPGCLDKELLQSLDEIRIRLNTLIKMAERLDLSSMRTRASTNFSALALMQRDFNAAAEAAESTLAQNHSSAEAKINLATAMLATGDLPRAVRALGSLPPEFKMTGMRLAAEAHYHACAFEPALDLWKKVVADCEDRLWRLRSLCRMLEVYRLLRDAKLAQACVDLMLTQFQYEPETLFALAYELWQMNRNDDAILALERAKSVASPNFQKWISWELGRVLFDAGKPLTAGDEYISVTDKSVDSVQAREYAVALFRAGLMPAAYERAKAIREANGEVVPGITEIETDYLVNEKKMSEAKFLLMALSKHRPLSVLNRMAVARICAHLDQEEEARAELDKMRELNLSEEMRDEVERFSKDLDVVISIKNQQSPKQV